MTKAVILIALPLLSFALLFFFGPGINRLSTRIVGSLGIALSSIYAMFLLWQGIGHNAVREKLWVFFPSELFSDEALWFSLYVDALSLTMTLVVTFVSALIAIYSTEYMESEEGIRRYFAVINLFVAFMLILVLGDSLWLLFIGWEGVGLCSYLLIGFYYREPLAVLASMKAFITTRIGDVFLLFGFFICFFLFGTQDIQIILSDAKQLYPNGSFLLTVAAFCLLLGAAGKSAQLPLQTWLPDAMWGPTPVSALIHAATMVTAGVYLIARMNVLFSLSYEASLAVMLVGLFTCILAAIAAFVQTDLKRVLAYSTMSQIGYMFLALGVSAFQAAIFHLVTHAFFKALLFLSAGVIGHALHSYDMRQMGGLRKKLPVIYFLFLLGAVNLMGIPLISGGFFSKEWILGQVFKMPIFGPAIFALGVFGTFLTGLYTTRMLILVFFGKPEKQVVHHSSVLMLVPLFVLAFFSWALGFLETPHLFGGIHVMSDFLVNALPANLSKEHLGLLFMPTIAVMMGASISIWLYGSGEARKSSSRGALIKTIIRDGVGFDWLYNKMIIDPYIFLASFLKSDVMETFFKQMVKWMNGIFKTIDKLHTGRLNHYVSFLIIGALAVASVMVF